MPPSPASRTCRMPLVLLGLVALAACDPIPPGPIYQVIDPPQERPSGPMHSGIYAAGMSVSEMGRITSECERLAGVQGASGGFPVERSTLMQQCLSRQGVQTVRLPECPSDVREAALRAGPSGRTVMPPLASDACIMTLPGGDQPILSNPSEYL